MVLAQSTIKNPNIFLHATDLSLFKFLKIKLELFGTEQENVLCTGQNSEGS